jgi:hypothetical protein
MISLVIILSVVLLHVSAGVSLFVSYTKIPLLEDKLDRCLIIQQHLRLLKSSGPVGRIIRSAFITHAIADKDRLHETGQIDKHQIEALPKPLLWWLKTSSWLGTLSLAILLIGVLTMKFSQ